LDSRTPAYGHSLRQLQILKFRGSGFRSGYHDFRILPGGLEVFPRLTASEHRASFDRDSLGSGVAELDKLLGGGIDRGTSTLLMGPPGTGKSTVALQFAAAAAANGDHAAAFIFEESRSVLLSRARNLGIRFVEGEGPGEVLVRQIDPTEVTPGEFACIVRREVEAGNARVVVIDSLNGYVNAMPEDRIL